MCNYAVGQSYAVSCPWKNTVLIYPLYVLCAYTVVCHRAVKNRENPGRQGANAGR